MLSRDSILRLLELVHFRSQLPVRALNLVCKKLQFQALLALLALQVLTLHRQGRVLLRQLDDLLVAHAEVELKLFDFGLVDDLVGLLAFEPSLELLVLLISHDNLFIELFQFSLNLGLIFNLQPQLLLEYLNLAVRLVGARFLFGELDLCRLLLLLYLCHELVKLGLCRAASPARQLLLEREG